MITATNATAAVTHSDATEGQQQGAAIPPTWTQPSVQPRSTAENLTPRTVGNIARYLDQTSRVALASANPHFGAALQHDRVVVDGIARQQAMVGGMLRGVDPSKLPFVVGLIPETHPSVQQPLYGQAADRLTNEWTGPGSRREFTDTARHLTQAMHLLPQGGEARARTERVFDQTPGSCVVS